MLPYHDIDLSRVPIYLYFRFNQLTYPRYTITLNFSCQTLLPLVKHRIVGF